jgi:hypothetical protein
MWDNLFNATKKWEEYLTSYETLMEVFAPYVFVLVGLVVSYSLYHFFSDSDLRVFLLLNMIIQFIIAGATQYTICVIVAVISLIPVILKRKGEESTNV